MAKTIDHLFGETRRDILQLLLIDTPSKTPRYQKEIVDLLGRGTGATIRELHKLVEMEVLTSEQDGRKKVYRVNWENRLAHELRNMVTPKAQKVTKQRTPKGQNHV